jgi:phenylacetate-CoA ligase
MMRREARKVSDPLRLGMLKLHELVTGRKVLACLETLNRTQWLEREQLLALQREKLQRVVAYAYKYVPFYRRSFDEAGFHPDDLRQDIKSLKALPIITKETIREHFDEMLTTEPLRRRKMGRKSTSGSTGNPLIFMQDSDFRDHVTADIQRHLGWAGWKIGEPHAYIWGASFESDMVHTLRNRLIDWTWNRFSTNAFLMNQDSMATFAAQIKRRRPSLLFGYASALHRFAQFVREGPYKDITFEGVFSSAELLLPAVRDFIEETFQCRMFNRYGTLELGGVACECEAHAGLHVSVENNYVEILRNGRPAQVGEMGDVVVTNLNNLGMPFIRYSIGDSSAWAENAGCPCGRVAPMLSTVHGRIVETFKTRDGRTAWAGFAGAGYSNLAYPAIKQFQIVQKSLDLMVVRLMVTAEVPQPTLDGITEAIKVAFGENVEVAFEFVDEIPALPSGKHQYAICEVQ